MIIVSKSSKHSKEEQALSAGEEGGKDSSSTAAWARKRRPWARRLASTARRCEFKDIVAKMLHLRRFTFLFRGWSGFVHGSTCTTPGMVLDNVIRLREKIRVQADDVLRNESRRPFRAIRGMKGMSALVR